ncbi:hypothetical protein RUND412_008103 [Rhizina undulata]
MSSSYVYPSIILFGDSLTERSFNFSNHGSGAALATAYARRADVLNRGVGGYNTRWLKPFLEHIVQNSPTKPLLFILLIGTNDSILPSGPNHVPLSEFHNNLLEMISLIRDSPGTSSAKILVLTPPPINVPLLTKCGGKDRTYETTREYAREVLEVVKEAKKKEGPMVAGVDLFHAFEAAIEKQRAEMGRRKREGEVEGWIEEWLVDGVHLGAKGYELMFQEIMAAVGKNWKEILPENLKLKVCPSSFFKFSSKPKTE